MPTCNRIGISALFLELVKNCFPEFWVFNQKTENDDIINVLKLFDWNNLQQLLIPAPGNLQSDLQQDRENEKEACTPPFRFPCPV